MEKINLVEGQIIGSGPLAAQNANLHHLGLVVPSIARAAEGFAASLSLRWGGRVVHDPNQNVKVSFFHPEDTRNPVYELVEPVGDASPVALFLKRGGGLHHVCYEVDDIDSAIGQAQAVGAAVASMPTPAAAFEGRRIAWVSFKHRLLMELLESKHK